MSSTGDFIRIYQHDIATARKSAIKLIIEGQNYWQLVRKQNIKKAIFKSSYDDNRLVTSPKVNFKSKPNPKQIYRTKERLNLTTQASYISFQSEPSSKKIYTIGRHLLATKKSPINAQNENTIKRKIIALPNVPQNKLLKYLQSIPNTQTNCKSITGAKSITMTHKLQSATVAKTPFMSNNSISSMISVSKQTATPRPVSRDFMSTKLSKPRVNRQSFSNLTATRIRTTKSIFTVDIKS